MLDDYLPDAWGRKVLAQLAFYSKQQRLNSHSVIDTLGLLGQSRIGCVSVVAKGEQPVYALGADVSALKKAELAAQQLEQGAFFQADDEPSELDEMSLLYLTNTGHRRWWC